ncbi:hypothetical protein [Sinomicrobium soli]|uniref:hypothetical protein n=1 Tax=Sinomicrobium sp. N-1-3-6 TaxID=2219864 RepID=UPI000DCD2D7D|nr:hypothetical protein [Sinomicrobium sp. N-1-3-6]RAV29388.1 hypothetical protein DN748_07735 [Sinomicrobium sp. N-1-3-6]
MNDNPSQRQGSDEIDLGVLLQKTGDFFKWIIRGVYHILMFYKRFGIALLILLIIAFVVGYFMDNSGGSSYKSEVVVVPNFGSADYLYSGIQEIETKRQGGDISFLKGMGLEISGGFNGITVEPVVDIYGFLEDTDRLEAFKALKGDMAMAKNPEMAVNYRYHRITIRTGRKNDAKEIVSAVLRFLNSNEYYRQVGDSLKKNMISRLETSREAALYVNDILRAQGSNTGGTLDPGSTAVVLRSEPTAASAELVDAQQELFKTIDKLSISAVDADKVVKEVSQRLDIPQRGIITTRKWMFPLTVFIVFSGIFLLIFLFRRMKEIATEEG